jgi:hypothetical protein
MYHVILFSIHFINTTYKTSAQCSGKVLMKTSSRSKSHHVFRSRCRAEKLTTHFLNVILCWQFVKVLVKPHFFFLSVFLMSSNIEDMLHNVTRSFFAFCKHVFLFLRSCRDYMDATVLLDDISGHGTCFKILLHDIHVHVRPLYINISHC